MTAGVLAFQGDFAEHLDVLHTLKVKSMEVRSLDDLQKVNALIIPGGESTVIAKFLWSTGVGAEIQKRVNAGTLSVYGTCAGAILLGKKVTGKNAPKPLGLMDITVDRNAYGTQLDSFHTTITVKNLKKGIDVSFIRAPIISKTGSDVEVLATHKDHTVLVRQGRLLAGTFHPEVGGETAIHRLFLRL